MLSEQIKQLHLQGLTPEQISEQLNLERPVVEYELLRINELSEQDIPEEDLRAIFGRLIDVAKNHEDDSLACHVGMFLVRQKRGAPGPQKAPEINIVQLNQMILASSQRVLNAIQAVSDARRNSGTTNQKGEKDKEA